LLLLNATIGGQPWQTHSSSGRIQAIGHQDYVHYRPQIEKLRSLAPQQTIDLYLDNEELINWLIEHHMDFASGQGFSKKFVKENFDGHRVQNSLNKPVQFLVDALNLGTENAIDMIKRRDQQFLAKKSIGTNREPLSSEEIESQNHQIAATMSRDLQELAKLTGDHRIITALTHLGGKHNGQQGWHHEPYKMPVTNTQDLIKQGFKGPDLGAEIKRRATDHYRTSLQNFVNQSNL
jgi:hypothetical protein